MVYKVRLSGSTWVGEGRIVGCGGRRVGRRVWVGAGGIGEVTITASGAVGLMVGIARPELHALKNKQKPMIKRNAALDVFMVVDGG